MNYSFHPEAESELGEAINYYEDCAEGLGLAFSSELFAAIDRIVSYPMAWASLDDGFRRCLLNRFPFGLIYEIHNEEILSRWVCN